MDLSRKAPTITGKISPGICIYAKSRQNPMEPGFLRRKAEDIADFLTTFPRCIRRLRKELSYYISRWFMPPLGKVRGLCVQSAQSTVLQTGTAIP